MRHIKVKCGMQLLIRIGIFLRSMLIWGSILIFLTEFQGPCLFDGLFILGTLQIYSITVSLAFETPILKLDFSLKTISKGLFLFI